tara:strand:+ start:76 stop:258 length:183 start_codon:yes stop_codon:yes gene_type:complete
MGNTKIQLKDNIKELYTKEKKTKGFRTLNNVTPTGQFWMMPKIANKNHTHNKNLNTNSVT